MQRAYMLNETIVDLAFFHDGIEANIGLHVNDVGFIRMPLHLDEQRPAVFEGVNVSVPVDIEGWLEWWYGPTWRIPQPSKRPAHYDSVCMEEKH